jgi:hypothetical protein
MTKLYTDFGPRMDVDAGQAMWHVSVMMRGSRARLFFKQLMGNPGKP